MKFNSQILKNEAYFVLYDKNDFIICYFDNLTELSKHINYDCKHLVYRFNKFGNPLNIVIGNEFYKLYYLYD